MQLAIASFVSLVLVLVTLASQPSQEKGRPVILVGEVVDSACFMIHPHEGATGPAHEDCGKACAARNVPLTIFNESDNPIYFAADGNKQLPTFRNQRVRLTGTAREKFDPMELKIAVEEKNLMTVRVKGGYKVVTIRTIFQTSPKNSGSKPSEPAKGSHLDLFFTLRKNETGQMGKSSFCEMSMSPLFLCNGNSWVGGSL